MVKVDQGVILRAKHLVAEWSFQLITTAKQCFLLELASLKMEKMG